MDGISVVTYNYPVLALEHFTKNKQDYRLVISDLRMPTLNGLEPLKRIKISNPQLSLFLTCLFFPC